MSQLVMGNRGTPRIGYEAVYGTPGTAGLFVPAKTFGNKPEQKRSKNPNIRSDYNPGVPGTMRKTNTGVWTLAPTVDVLPAIWELFFGNRAFTDHTTYGDHVSYLGSDPCLPFTMEHQIALDTAQFQLSVGCMIGKISIPFGPDDFSLWSIDTACKDTSFEAATFASTDIDLSGGEVLDNYKIDTTSGIKIGGSLVDFVSKGVLNVSSNLFLDDYVVAGGGARGSVANMGFTVDGSITIGVRSAAALTRITGGSNVAMELLWNLGTNRSHNIELANVYFNMSGTEMADGPMYVDIGFEAAVGALSGPLNTTIRATTVNNIVDASYA